MNGQGDRPTQLSELPLQELEARLQLMGEIARQRQVTQKCAADAANYVHPKLANISHANDPDHPLIISDEERAKAVLALLAESVIDLTTIARLQ